MDNLLNALAQAWVGESQARNRYTLHSKVARNEGYQQIMNIFLQTAEHEKTHAKNYFKMIKTVLKKMGKTMDELSINEVAVPLINGTTIENLKASIAGETHEADDMYPKIAALAEKNGFDKIATQIKAIGEAEKHHAARYQKLLDQIEAKTIFKKKEKVWWYCLECGYWELGEKPPEICPSCDHPPAFFQKLDENY
jgi:rubrerythrin